jgi:hypothetical protein
MDELLSTLHSPPLQFGLNRTSWRLADLKRCLSDKGIDVSKPLISLILKFEGYRWRKAKTVLTSNDPEYEIKLKNIQNILKNLKENEAFFSIDEFGPISIRMKGGKKLVGPHEYPHVLKFQESKGEIIVTAALELSRNRITYFYSSNKNTDEMIKLLSILVDEFPPVSEFLTQWLGFITLHG